MSVWSRLDLSSGSVPDRISRGIAGLIDDGTLSAGSSLPSERELMELTGVSRNSVREALQELEMRGYITSRPRSGRVVASIETRDLHWTLPGLGTSTQSDLRRVMDLRAVLEPPIAQRAAVRRRVEDLELLRAPLEEAEAHLGSRPLRYDVIYECDVRFHAAIATMTHNPLLEHLVRETQQSMALSRQAAFRVEPRVQEALVAHRAIYHAIADGDPDRAHEAMIRHLREVYRVLETTPPG